MGRTCCRGVPGAGVALPLLLLLTTHWGRGESAMGGAWASRK
jgi:hypothetical protein